MQKYDDQKGERRLINIFNMKLEEVEDYYYSKFHREPKEKQAQYTKNLKKRINELLQQQEVSEWILGIYKKGGKLIGKIEVYSSDSVNAFLKIEIPNEVESFQYGVAAIKQFRKICAENHYLERVELESNKISERYKRAYNLDSNFIEIA